jgi:anaerobic selenocysteine-containing dehydrogenase
MEVRTACPLDCWDTCTVLATVKDGIVTGLRGDPENTTTRGFLCPKARFQLERMYSPTRLLHPLLRSAGGWKQVTWNEARALVCERISDAVARHGSHSLYYHHDAGSMGHLHNLSERLFNALGGATLPAGSLCWGAGIAAQVHDFGAYLANDPFDVLNARTIVLWGRDPAATNIHLVPLLKQARSLGARVIVIDPVKTASASLADIVIRPMPGTDGALALAASNHLASTNACDTSFLARNSLGYDGFRAISSRWSLVRASWATGVPEGEIKAFAEQLLRRPVCFLLGYGLQRHKHGGKTVRAVDALGALCGSIGVRGGGVNYANGHVSSRLANLRGSELVGARQTRTFQRVSLGNEIIAASPPVEVAFFARSNPLAQSPGLARLEQALETVPFKVCVDFNMTDTARRCDLVLPAATFLEQDNIHYCSWHNHAVFAQKAVEPLGEARPDWGFFSDIAQDLKVASFPARSALEWMDEAIAPLVAQGLLPGAQALLGQSIRFPGAPEVAWADRKFATPSGKFEFYSERCACEDPESRGYAGFVDPAGSARFPLTLISRRHPNALHSQFYDRIGRPALEVFVSAVDALARQVSDGDRVLLSNETGSVRAVLRVDRDLAPGTAYVFEGGSPSNGQSINYMTPAGPTDIGLGSRYNECRVDVIADNGQDGLARPTPSP